MNYQRFPGAKYANIFSYLAGNQNEEYEELGEQTLGLVGDVPGYLGYESVKNDAGRTIFISYWESLEAVDQWRRNNTHAVAKSKGKDFYKAYHSMLTRIEYSSEHNTKIL